MVDLPKPRADFPDVVMPALAEYLVDARQGPVDPFRDRFAAKPETASLGRRAIVREAQEVECLRLARPAPSSVHDCEPPELHEAGLVGVKAEAESGQPLPNVAEVTCLIEQRVNQQ
ncbi:MAG: hypothetical protein OXI57_10170 [Rhodospirillales bacterium]|nr:hypothetical protein [Rhodospirillales bacterium]